MRFINEVDDRSNACSGCIHKRGTNGQATDRQVLPIRMETSLVQKLDAARKRLGLKNRTELFRRSVREYMNKAGETEVAKLLS